MGAGIGTVEGAERGTRVGEAVGAGTGLRVGRRDGSGDGFRVATAVVIDATSTVAPVSEATKVANEGAARLELRLSAKDDGVEAPGIEDRATITVNDTSQLKPTRRRKPRKFANRRRTAVVMIENP